MITVTAPRAGSPADRVAAPGYHRETVASFSSYLEAERAIARLASRGLPVDRVSIVAHGLRVVSEEQPAARVSRASEAALAGLPVGALAALLGWLVGLWDDASAPLAVGTASGVLGGLAAEQVAFGRRGPATAVRLSAERYDLSADPRFADEIAEAIEFECRF